MLPVHSLIRICRLYGITMQEKGVSVLEAVKRQQLWFRWLIYLAAIFVVLLTGIYGPGFAASSFIYFQF